MLSDYFRTICAVCTLVRLPSAMPFTVLHVIDFMSFSLLSSVLIEKKRAQMSPLMPVCVPTLHSLSASTDVWSNQRSPVFWLTGFVAAHQISRLAPDRILFSELCERQIC